ncbi:MAG: hypothetical protein QGG31_01690, partial [Anaerolineales bacterium]|nr:hypothetical protein [Anaerolineales bacterium]
ASVKALTSLWPHAGIVTVRTRGVNQDGKVVLNYRRTVMIYKRDHALDTNHFPEIQEEQRSTFE